MAMIPRGNFGNSIAAPQQAVASSPNAHGAAAAQAFGQLGHTVAGTIDDVRKKLQADEEAVQSNEAMGASIDHEIGMKQAATAYLGRLERGEIEPGEAESVWADMQSEVHANTLGRLKASRFSSAAFDRAKLVNFSVNETIQRGLDTHRQQRFATDAATSLDRFGKLAMLPGESLDKALAMADQTYPQLAARGGIPPARAAHQLQTWKDNLRYQRAKLDLVGNRRSLEGLEQFMQRLDGGDLRGTLDADKLTALTKEAESFRWQLQQATQHATEQREKAAERAVGEATRQIEEGVPLSLDGWDGLRRKVEGTQSAPDFNRLVEQERATQQLLRLQIDQQQAYVQQREAELMQNGGTLADKGNLGRIKATVAYNVKQLQEAPLVAAQRLYGRETKPIDWADLVEPGGAERAAELFNSRAVTLQAMRKQYGNTVGFKPLMPQEVAPILAVLDQASPQTAVGLFGSLRQAIGSDDVYQAAMGQIAADSPVKARAGLLAALKTGTTLERNLVADDQWISGTKVAQTMLIGEALLSKTRGQKGLDGRPGNLLLPSQGSFESDFVAHVGDLYRGRPEAQAIDLQSAWAYYVGRAAEAGRLAEDPKDIDTKLVREAVRATIGEVINVNGHGNAKAPFGMSGVDFRQKAREAFAQEVRARGLPASMEDQWHAYGLQNWAQDGTYILTLGDAPVIDPKTREPVVLDLIWRGMTGRRFGRTTSETIPTGGNALPAGSAQ